MRVLRIAAARFAAAIRTIAKLSLEPEGDASVLLCRQHEEAQMPRGDKSKYTDKQERKADHIAEGYEKRGVSEEEAERRAWATVNKDDGGGKKAGGSGRGKETGHPAAHRGGEKGGKAAASRSAEDRSASAKKAAATRKKNAEHRAHS